MSCASNGHKETVVLMETTMGDIKVKLYDDTPAHRDNFVKLAFYNTQAVKAAVKDYYDRNGIAYDQEALCSGDCAACGHDHG